MIKVGIIGYGYWGPKILRNFYSLKDCKVEMIADLNPLSLKDIKKFYPDISVTSDYKDILQNKNIKGVSIATPAFTHYSLAKEALLSGKDVLVEKPMALSLKQGKELVNLSKKEKKILMIGHTFEYSPTVRKIKEILKKRELGRIYFISSSRVNLGLHRKDVNVVWDLVPHDISILTYLLNSNPIDVSVKGKSFVRKGVEDFAFVEFEFPNEIIADIHVSWLYPFKQREVIIAGSKKTLVYDDTNIENPIAVYDKGIDLKAFKESKNNLIKYYDKGVSYPKVDKREPLNIECEHFIQCIKNRKTPLTNGERGLDVLKILEAVQKSMDSNGNLVKIN